MGLQVSKQVAEVVLRQVVTTCRLYRIERKDGAVLRYCEHDAILDFREPGASTDSEYVPTTGAWAMAQRRETGLRDVSSELRGVVAEDITDDHLRAGLYNGAVVDEFVVDWRKPWRGYLERQRYYIGDVTRSGETWDAVIHGQTRPLRKTFGEVYGPPCKNTPFGGSRCGKNLANHTRTGVTVSAATNRQIFRVASLSNIAGEPPLTGSGSFDEPHFMNARITWTTGANADAAIVSEVSGYDASTREFTIYVPVPFNIAANDAFTLVTGCGYTQHWCHDYHNNMDNFGGDILIPGPDRSDAPPLVS